MSSRTLESYRHQWNSVKQQLMTSRNRLRAIDVVDSKLSKRLEDLYMDGEDLSAAQYLVAAVMFFNPSLRSPGMQLLPQTKQSMKGWRRLAPEKSRLPVPWEVTAMLVQESFKEKMFHLGLHMLLMFCLYLRPSEALRLRASDIVAPAHNRKKAYQHWTVVLNPQEVGIPSKTFEFDESLQLDLPYHANVGIALAKFMKSKRIGGSQLIFTHGTAELNDFLSDMSTKLKLTKIGPLHAYRFRHGGASHDCGNQLRDLAAIQQRGRWKTASSMRRYQKGGRLAQLFGSLPESVQSSAIQASDSLAELLRRQP